MRIAVTYENGQIFQHFGHTPGFKLYDIAEGKVVYSGEFPSLGSGHGALADLLASIGASALICGGIGGGARFALQDADIEIFGGVMGDADEAVEAFLGGALAFNPNACCNHHHEGGHSCGDHHHDCGHDHHDHHCGHGDCGHHH